MASARPRAGGRRRTETADVFEPPPASVYFNVEDYGAVGNGVENDRPAIQRAIEAALAAGGGVVFFPTGTYSCLVSRGGRRGIPTFELSGTGSSKLLFMGCGRASHIVMTGEGKGDRRLFDIKNGCQYIGFKSLKFSSELTRPSEQQHLLHWETRTSSPPVETGRSFVLDCYFGHTRGDAIRFLGDRRGRSKTILVKRCVFQMQGPPRSRSAISFQRASDEVTIDACYTTNASPIDFEPTGVGSNERHRIIRNHFVGNLTLTGNGAGEEHRKSVYSHNTNVGTVSGGDVEQLVMSGNIVDALAGAPGSGAVRFFERIHEVTVTDNILWRQGDTRTAVTFTIARHSVGDNRGLVVDGNIIVHNNATADGGALSLHDCSRSIVSGNLCTVNITADNRGVIMRQEATTEVSGETVFAGNMGICTNKRTKHGIVGGTLHYSVIDNLIRNVITGVTCTGNAAGQQACVARNILQSTVNAVSLLNGVKYVQIGGFGGARGASIYQVVVPPNDTVPAATGSIALRSSGGRDRTTLYVKEASLTETTGWIAK